MRKAIYFDLDGTLASLYSVENWLNYLLAEDTYPYAAAAVMHNMSLLARYLHKVQKKGYSIGIISWTSKSGSDEYHKNIDKVKRAWLNKHLPSVVWNEIKIVRYGTNKYNECGGGILFDDEERNRNNWHDIAYTPDKIFSVLKKLTKEGE